MSFAPKPPSSPWPVILKCWATGLLLMGAVAVVLGQDVPAWVLRGIAAVETRTTWRDIGDLEYRDRRVGKDGEVGPWQLSPAVLRDLGAYDRRARVHAESLTRAWLLHLRRETRSWPEAVAAFHGGLDRRTESFAITYAGRVRALGTIY